MIPSLQLSVPGQLTTSVTSRAPASPRPRSTRPPPDVVQRLVAHPAQDEVLLHGAAGAAAGELAHQPRQPSELLRREVSAVDLHLDRREALLALGLDVALEEAVELGAVAIGGSGCGGRVGGAGLLVVVEAQQLDVEVALVHPVALQLFVDQLAEGVDPDFVDQDLDPGAGAIDAQPILAVEDPEDRLGDLQVLAVVGRDELVEGRGDAGHDRGAAADPYLEALDAVALAADEGDVVDAGDRPVFVGAGEGSLDLARHQLRGRVADEVADVGAGVGGRVEDLVGGDAGPGVAGDVAHRVAAALAGGEADGGDLADQRLHVAQRHVVDLDVLAGRDVTLVQRRPALDDIGEDVHLLGSNAAEGKLDADHLDVGLALPVDALFEAEADELVFGGVAGEELLGLGVEVVELALEDRDHVAGDVLVALRVLQRAAALAALLLALDDVESGQDLLSPIRGRRCRNRFHARRSSSRGFAECLPGPQRPESAK